MSPYSIGHAGEIPSGYLSSPKSFSRKRYRAAP